MNGGETQDAPRVLRRLETLLLRAELEWRVGKEQAVQARLSDDLRALKAEMEQARRVTLPPVHSVGQARAFERPADPVLEKELKELLERRKPQPFAPPEQIKAQLAAAVQGFLGTMKKGKTSLDLAHTIADASGDLRFDPETVKFLDSLVVGSAPKLDVIELRILRQLALRAASARGGDWDDEVAKMIWDTVLLAEEANNRPFTLPWVRGLLDEADALRHEAQILLLPQAYAYASPAQISQAWQRVADAYGIIDNGQRKIRHAQTILNRARAVLPAYLPYLEGTGRAGRESDWHTAAQIAHQLDLLVEESATSSESEPLTRERLGQLSGELADTAQKLETQLTGLLRPFQSEALRGLVRQCESDRPGPGLAEEIESILATPFPPAADRPLLWRAGLVLDRRLGELNFRTSGSASDSSATNSDRKEVVREIAARRVSRLSAMLQLACPAAAGDRPGTTADLAPELNAPSRSSIGDAAADLAAVARTWSLLARASSVIHNRLHDLAGQDQDDRPGWIAPAFTLESGSDPARQAQTAPTAPPGHGSASTINTRALTSTTWPTSTSSSKRRRWNVPAQIS